MKKSPGERKYSKRFTLPMRQIDLLAKEENESEIVRRALDLWYSVHPQGEADSEDRRDGADE